MGISVNSIPPSEGSICKHASACVVTCIVFYTPPRFPCLEAFHLEVLFICLCQHLSPPTTFTAGQVVFAWITLALITRLFPSLQQVTAELISA